MDEDEQVNEAFTSPDDISDVILIVEDKRIFAHKSILGKDFSLALLVCFFSLPVRFQRKSLRSSIECSIPMDFVNHKPMKFIFQENNICT